FAVVLEGGGGALAGSLGHSRGDRRRVQSTTGCPQRTVPAGEQRVPPGSARIPGRSTWRQLLGRDRQAVPTPARLPLAPPGPAQRLVLRRGFLVFLTEDRGGALRAQAVHGHAHYGSERGMTPGGVLVRNVAHPVIRQAYSLFHLDVPSPVTEELAGAERATG